MIVVVIMTGKQDLLIDLVEEIVTYHLISQDTIEVPEETDHSRRSH